MRLNFDLEVWVSFASLALGVMFVLLLASFYSFLVGPDKLGPDRYVDISGVIIKTISISGAPSVILAAITYGLSKSHGNRLAGCVVSITGIIIIIGMSLSLGISSEIPSDFFQEIILYVPYIFVVVSIGIVIIGLKIYLISKKGVRPGKFH